MKSLKRTIIVLVILNLAMGSSAFAEWSKRVDVPESIAEVDEPVTPGIQSAPQPTETPRPSKISPPVLPSPARSTGFMGATFGGSDWRKALVIPSEEVKAEDIALITQDLQIMSHIFDERFSSQPRLTEGAFMDFGDFFEHGRRETEAIYLQGYGVLFLMEMNISFKSQTEPQEEETTETEEQADSVWQQARQEVFSPQERVSDRRPYKEEKHDAERIEELKSELIKTLKHAANIQSLKPDEWVIVTVLGSGPQPSRIFIGTSPRIKTGGDAGRSRSTRSSSRSYSYGGGYGGGYGSFGGGSSSGFSGMGGYAGADMGDYYSETVLTIRVKKSDVDAFANDELDFDRFQQKVQIFTY